MGNIARNMSIVYSLIIVVIISPCFFVISNEARCRAREKASDSELEDVRKLDSRLWNESDDNDAPLATVCENRLSQRWKRDFSRRRFVGRTFRATLLNGARRTNYST